MGGLIRIPRRLRVLPTRYIVTTALAFWAVLVVVLPLIGALPSDARIGGATRQLHGELRWLGRGWLPGINTLPPGSKATGPVAWVASAGPQVEIRPDPSWRVVNLALSPSGCSLGQSELVAWEQQSDRPSQVSPMGVGLQWYRFAITRSHPRPLHLSLTCTANGSSNTARVDIAGIRGSP